MLNTACGCVPQVFEIFTGQDKTLPMVALYQNGSPLDLTECTEINVQLPNADGTHTVLLLSLGQVAITSPTNLGRFSAPITAQTSSLLNTGELQNIDVSFTIDGLITAVRFYQALTVVEF